MRRIGSTWSLLILVGLMAVLVWCTGCPEQPPETVIVEDFAPDEEPLGDPIKIGAVFALTGPASSLGEPERDTAVMLQEQINAAGGVDGRPLEIIVRDTKSDEVEGLTAVR